MIRTGTELKVIDNTGVKYVKCIKVLRVKSAGSKIDYAKVGDLILVSVKILKPLEKIKKGQKFKALVVRTCAHIKRIEGSFQFFENSVILLNKKLEPVGSKVVGPIALEVVEQKFAKLNSLYLRYV
jgi:large subunit ribosomal protein L14